MKPTRKTATPGLPGPGGLRLEDYKRLERVLPDSVAVIRAYRSFHGTMIHDLRCGPPEILGEMRDQPADDPRCDCGLRDLASALERLCGS